MATVVYNAFFSGALAHSELPTDCQSRNLSFRKFRRRCLCTSDRNQVVDDLRQYAVIENNHLTYTGNTNWEQVTFGDTVSSSSDFTYQFANQSLTIRKGSDILSELTYEGLNTDDFASKETLTATISKKWYQANRAAVGLSITLISTFILTTKLLFILLGASFFLF